MNRLTSSIKSWPPWERFLFQYLKCISSARTRQLWAKSSTSWSTSRYKVNRDKIWKIIYLQSLLVPLKSPGQTIATYRNIVVHNMLHAFGHPVAICCDMLRIVAPCLNMVKFFGQHLWMLHDVVLVWPPTCNIVVPEDAQ